MARLLNYLSAWHARRLAKLEASASRAQRPDEGIGAEAPIRSQVQDRLRRADFAERIASVLSELSLLEGRVFAIRGGWGFGKSSLKNLITEKLDAKDEGADWLDFNPWQWGDGDAIARALFSQIANRLGGELSKEALDRAEALRRYGAMLTGTVEPLKVAGGSSHLISMVLTNVSVIAVASAIGFNLPTVAKIAAALAVLSVIIHLLGRVLSYLGRDRGSEPLNKVREVLEERLRKLKRPLVIFVDDIDRLEPEQIRMLLRQVKANANLPNIVFVLLFQSSIVERALDPVADDDGRAFLEKIVQTNFDLPVVPISVVHQIFGEELSKLAGSYAIEENGFTQKRWGNAFVGCIQPMLRNMRDARRLISSIAVHMPLHSTDGVLEVNIVDFLILETLRVFEPDLHDTLPRMRELLLQEQRYSGVGHREEDKTAAERLLAIVSEERRSIAQNMLKQLFPPIEWAYGGTNYSDDFRRKWLTAKRVCSARYFPRYFELQTAAGEISELRFITFLEATATEDELAVAIAEVKADNLLSSLVARFDESVDRLPVENASVLLPGMFSIAQELAGLRSVDPFNSPWVAAWRATSWYLERIPENLRGDLALEALRRTKALSVAAILIHLSDPDDQKEGRTFDPALDFDTVRAMKAEWLQLIRSRAAHHDELADDPDLMSLLYQWRDYAGSLDEPREWVTKAIRTDEGFASMATCMMTRGMTHSSGDYISTTYFSFNRETVDDFIGIEIAKDRCDVIDSSKFPNHKEALDTLRTFLDKWFGKVEADSFN